MKSKYKKALIVPYFGKFNNYFPLWLKSCEYNNDYDWLIYTDDHTDYSYPNNVHVKYITFDLLKERISSLFKFKIALESPYKLCDYRPAYGEIFYADLKGYDFWGYCDVDLIWGQLSTFFTDDILDKYDKISDAGHFTLYRNNEEMRSAYRTLRFADCFDYKSVYSCPENFAFDEWGKNKGINRILLNAGCKIYYKPIYFSDIKINTYGLLNTRDMYDLKDRRIQERKKHNILFVFDRGQLMQYALDSENNLITNEEAYVHLQKRPMQLEKDVVGNPCFILYPPNSFKKMPKRIDIEFLKTINEHKFYWHYYEIRLNNLKRKMKRWIKLDGKM